MSAGDHASERAALEAKDRDELQQIVGALGGKVTSRTRKGEMIDQILELTGVTPAEAADANGGDAGKSGATDKADAGARGGAAAGAGSNGGGARPSSRAQGERSRDTQAASDDAKGSRDQQPAKDGGRGQQASDDGKGGGQQKSDGQKGQSQKDGGQQKSDGQKGQSQKDGGQQKSDGQKGQSQKDGGQQKSDGQKGQSQKNDGDKSDDNDDDVDSGNRRRRRRGRNRDNQNQEEFQGEPVEVAGHLDLRSDGYGFLRVDGYLPSRQDAYVSVKQTREFGLRNGDHLTGASRPAFRNEKNPALLRIDSVNGQNPEEAKNRPDVADLTPVFPTERLALGNGDINARAVDLLAPIGKGQRALLISPHKSGKTSMLLSIGHTLSTDEPDVHLLVLLLDGRPEEATEYRRQLPAADVVSTTFDRPPEEHSRVADLVVARAERMLEEGRDVVLLLDGITRLVRANNIAGSGGGGGRQLPGGLDTTALYPVRRLFGAARKLDEGGSLTIVATVAAETRSAIDQVILEEFRGTANCEIRLDRRLAERRVFPALDVLSTETDNEALLYGEDRMDAVRALRARLADLSPGDTGGHAGALVEHVVGLLGAHADTEAVLDAVAKAAK